MTTAKTLRTCKQGHSYYKSSDCPTCPVCEKEKSEPAGFLARLGNPARNALLHQGVDTLDKLAGYSEREILKLHGIGKASLPSLRQSLADAGMSFKSLGSPDKL